MVNIRDRMGNLVKGIFRVEIEDNEVKDGKVEFELKPTEGHKAELLYLFKRQNERDIVFAGKAKANTLTEDDFVDRDKFNKEMFLLQTVIMKEVLKNSYNDMSPEEIVSILNKYDNALFEELCMAYGWISTEMKEAQKKAIQKELKKLSGEEEPPENKPPQNELKK